jgi:hypothetical protein
LPESGKGIPTIHIEGIFDMNIESDKMQGKENERAYLFMNQ